MSKKYWDSKGRYLAEIKRIRGKTIIVLSDYKEQRSIELKA